MKIKIIDNEFNGFLSDLDIVEAGIVANELRKIQNYSCFGQGTKSSVVEDILKHNGQFYDGDETQKRTRRFCVRSPKSMWFAYVPKPLDCWFQVSKTQYEYGIYLESVKNK